MRCVVVGGSLIGLSTAIALSRLGIEVTVAERSPASAVEGGGGLGVDTGLLREVTGIAEDPPVLHGADRDTAAWHLLQGWLEDHAVRRPGVRVLRDTEVTAVLPGSAGRGARLRTAGDDVLEADLVIGATARAAPYAAPSTRITQMPITPVCCCGAPWFANRPCRPRCDCPAPVKWAVRCTPGRTGW